MYIKYHSITTANKDIFRGKEKKKEEGDYNSFIDSLQKIDIEDTDVIKKISDILKAETIDEDVKKEIITRLEAKYGNRK